MYARPDILSLKHRYTHTHIPRDTHERVRNLNICTDKCAHLYSHTHTLVHACAHAHTPLSRSHLHTHIYTHTYAHWRAG